MGRRGTIWDLGTAPRRRISLRISPGGSRPLNLNVFFHIFGAQKCQHVNFWDFFENGHPHRGRIWPDLGPKGPQGALGALFTGDFPIALKGSAAWPKAYLFAAPPQGEQGVLDLKHQSAESAVPGGLHHAADPSKLDAKMHNFSSLNFSTFFFRPNLQNLRK